MHLTPYTGRVRRRIAMIFVALFSTVGSAQELPEEALTDPSVPPKSSPDQQEDVLDILIKNVSIVDADVPGRYPEVSILIKNHRIDVITKDEVPIKETTLVINAEDGFLVGALEIGSRATFIVLDEDPAHDINVLLDTKEHIELAISSGDIVKNRYGVEAVTPETAKRRSRSGWLAYTPPPLAAPANYRDSRKWNRWDTKAISGIFLGALMLDRMNWKQQSAASETQVGELDKFSGGAIRGLRFGAIGTLNFANPWVYTIFGATHAFDKGFDQTQDDKAEIIDARLDIPTYGNTTLSIGKQKAPISLQRLTPLLYISQQERTASIDAMLPSRSTGAVLSGNLFNQRMAWAGGVFNNWLDSDTSFSDTASQAVGRLSGVPLVSQDESNLVHLAIGARYSNAKNGIRFLSKPEFAQSPVFVDTDPGVNEDGTFEAKDFTTWNAELAWRKGPLLLASEYQLTNVNSPTYDDPRFTGYYVSGIWALTGEMRTYDYRGGVFTRPPVARSVYRDGWGAWELTARYSNVDFDDGLIRGGTMDIASAGLRWWLTPYIYVDANYRYITLERFGTIGYSNGFQTRLMISLE